MICVGYGKESRVNWDQGGAQCKMCNSAYFPLALSHLGATVYTKEPTTLRHDKPSGLTLSWPVIAPLSSLALRESPGYGGTSNPSA